MFAAKICQAQKTHFALRQTESARSEAPHALRSRCGHDRRHSQHSRGLGQGDDVVLQREDIEIYDAAAQADLVVYQEHGSIVWS